MAIGKADHETITYIGRHRRLQVYAYSFSIGVSWQYGGTIAI